MQQTRKIQLVLKDENAKKVYENIPYHLRSKAIEQALLLLSKDSLMCEIFIKKENNSSLDTKEDVNTDKIKVSKDSKADEKQKITTAW